MSSLQCTKFEETVLPSSILYTQLHARLSSSAGLLQEIIALPVFKGQSVQVSGHLLVYPTAPETDRWVAASAKMQSPACRLNCQGVLEQESQETGCQTKGHTPWSLRDGENALLPQQLPPSPPSTTPWAPHIPPGEATLNVLRKDTFLPPFTPSYGQPSIRVHQRTPKHADCHRVVCLPPRFPATQSGSFGTPRTGSYTFPELRRA